MPPAVVLAVGTLEGDGATTGVSISGCVGVSTATGLINSVGTTAGGMGGLTTFGEGAGAVGAACCAFFPQAPCKGRGAAAGRA